MQVWGTGAVRETESLHSRSVCESGEHAVVRQRAGRCSCKSQGCAGPAHPCHVHWERGPTGEGPGYSHQAPGEEMSQRLPFAWSWSSGWRCLSLVATLAVFFAWSAGTVDVGSLLNVSRRRYAADWAVTLARSRDICLH